MKNQIFMILMNKNKIDGFPTRMNQILKATQRWRIKPQQLDLCVLLKQNRKTCTVAQIAAEYEFA